MLFSMLNQDKNYYYYIFPSCNRFTDYFVENGIRYRTLTKAFGIRFELIVFGTVRNIKSFMKNFSVVRSIIYFDFSSFRYGLPVLLCFLATYSGKLAMLITMLLYVLLHAITLHYFRFVL